MEMSDDQSFDIDDSSQQSPEDNIDDIVNDMNK